MAGNAETGEVIQGECHFAGTKPAHGHAVHAWFGDNRQLDADPIAWMPYANQTTSTPPVRAA